MSKIQHAEALANTAHGHQWYNESKPYLWHAKEVAGFWPDYVDEYIVGLLHDVVEDSDVTIDEIRKFFGDEIAEAVYALTRPPLVSYSSYIADVAVNEHARRVKIIDLSNNLANCFDVDGNLRKSYKNHAAKYSAALRFLFAYPLIEK